MFFKTILRPITNAEKAEAVGLLMVRRAHNGSVKRFSRPLLQTKDVRARVGVAKRQDGGKEGAVMICKRTGVRHIR